MDEMKYFYELYSLLPRGGPGDNASTQKGFSLMKDVPEKPYILDIGCGPGMQTLELARISNGIIQAIDNYDPFLETLEINAKKSNLNSQIVIKNQSMLNMDFKDNTFDIIWSEGALYFMGFGNGLRKCKELLKDNGYLAVTEAVYLLPERPKQVVQFWESEYPDITSISNNIKIIQNTGLKLVGNFTLPKSSWIDDFYAPMKTEITKLKKKYKNNPVALEVFNVCLNEINVYNKYSDFFGYEFFIMQNTI